jgi:prepilin-type N-terminal cleavage/methylation domain-containing protein
MISSTPSRSRGGFTAIELVIVLTVAAIIIASSVPAVLSAMRRNNINRAADAIITVAEEARRLSRTYADPAKRYGVAVVMPENGPAYAVLLHGQLPIDELRNPSTGEALVKRVLPAAAVPYTDVSIKDDKRKYKFMAPDTRIGWFYGSGTGRIIDMVGQPLEIGTDDQRGLSLVTTQSAINKTIRPQPSYFGVASIDGTCAVGMAFFHIGLGFSRAITSR